MLRDIVIFGGLTALEIDILQSVFDNKHKDTRYETIAGQAFDRGRYESNPYDPNLARVWKLLDMDFLRIVESDMQGPYITMGPAGVGFLEEYALAVQHKESVEKAAARASKKSTISIIISAIIGAVTAIDIIGRTIGIW